MFSKNKHSNQTTLTQLGTFIQLGQYEEESSQLSDEQTYMSDGDKEITLSPPPPKKARTSKIKTLLQTSSDEDVSSPTKTEEMTPSPPSVARNSSTVAAFSAATFKSEQSDRATVKKEQEETSSRENTGELMPANQDIDPDFTMTPLRPEKRNGVWVGGLAICLEDIQKTRTINNNIANAIGEYIERVYAKLNWVDVTYNSQFWYGEYDFISALQNLRRQLVCISIRLDVLDEKTLKRAFPCMDMEGTFTWFKSFMTMFGRPYELEPHCNLTNFKYTLKMVWVRRLN